MRAIYKRELRACFHSFIGWLFLAVVLFLTGLYTTVYLYWRLRSGITDF